MHHLADWRSGLWAEPWANHFSMHASRGALLDLDTYLRDGSPRGEGDGRFDFIPPAEKPMVTHSTEFISQISAGAEELPQGRELARQAFDMHLAFGGDDFSADLAAMLSVRHGPEWIKPLDAPIPL